MRLTDTENNTKIVYLYVKSFEWQSSDTHEVHGGHPRAGELYRAVVNTGTRTYRLFYQLDEQLNGMFLTLLNVAPEEDTDKEYFSDIVEISKTNIVELQLKESQLDQLTEWIKENNKPITDFMGLQPQGGDKIDSTPPPQMMTTQQVMEHIRQAQERESFTELGTFLAEMSQADPTVYTALSDFIYSLADPPPGGHIDTTWTAMSPTLGAGRNISKAIEYLARYGGDDRKTNLEVSDLLLAMRTILEEVTRRQIHSS